ncbi:YjfB family protein [Cohnella soli]|uniref:YjfB family protein n=1 Tax=Cohnella soli TaxID=425005 RepID=A0ABW0HXN3_9BACL
MEVGGTLSAAQLQNSVSIAVIGKALDQAETQGQQLVQMLQTNIHPYLGQNLDIKA